MVLISNWDDNETITLEIGMEDSLVSHFASRLLRIYFGSWFSVSNV